jgi:beta-galactosidase
VRRLTTDWRFKKKEGNWQTVSLPHTAHIEPYISNSMWMGICFYQKEIDYEPAWEGKKMSVEFEGAMLVAKVSLNGKLLIEHFDGYMGFEVDLTPHLKKGKNLLEVELDNNWRGDVPLGKPWLKSDTLSLEVRK